MNKPFLTIILVSLIFIGCSHNMQITNTADYFLAPASPLKVPLKLGVTSSNDADAQNSRYITSIVDALQRTGSFERIIYPFNQSVHQGMADVIVDIAVNPQYSGRISNFFVNWPGFLIFAPAIWGYGYNAEIETRVNILHMESRRSQPLTIPVKYKFRQAEMDRTWTEIGWLEWGVIPLVGGFVFTSYDSDLTDEFITKVSPYYGPYITKKILEAM